MFDCSVFIQLLAELLSKHSQVCEGHQRRVRWYRKKVYALTDVAKQRSVAARAVLNARSGHACSAVDHMMFASSCCSFRWCQPGESYWKAKDIVDILHTTLPRSTRATATAVHHVATFAHIVATSQAFLLEMRTTHKAAQLVAHMAIGLSVSRKACGAKATSCTRQQKNRRQLQPRLGIKGYTHFSLIQAGQLYQLSAGASGKQPRPNRSGSAQLRCRRLAAAKSDHLQSSVRAQNAEYNDNELVKLLVFVSL